MGKNPGFFFYVKDWLSDPQLKMAAHSTKGIWIDMICFMWDAPVRGELTATVPQLVRLIGATELDMALFFQEAETLRFCYAVTDDNKNVTVRNRRMWRDEKDRNENAIRQQRYRDKRKSNGEVSPLPQRIPFPYPKKEVSKDTLSPEASGNGHCPHEEIIALYHEKLPMLRTVREWNNERQRILRARWREDESKQSLEWWTEYFEYVKKCPFLVGQNDTGWQADLEWLVRPRNFAKVIEGNYDPRKQRMKT